MHEWKREGEKKIFFSFEPTNLLKACSTQIGLLTRGMSLRRHLNVHVVHPIITEKLYRPHLSYSVLLFFEMKATAEAFHVIRYKDSIKGNVTSRHISFLSYKLLINCAPSMSAYKRKTLKDSKQKHTNGFNALI